jgi:hypothetical protein
MSKRPEAPSEKALHKRMVESDAARGGLKGGVVGTALGAGLRHLGHAGKHAPLHGAAIGTALGTISGYHHGKERELRDTVQQERQHMRAEARTKKAYDQAMWAGFADELQKVAIMPPALGTLASGAGNVLGGIGRSLAGAGLRTGATRGITGSVLGGLRRVGFAGDSAYKALGGAALGAGALGAAALGRASAPSQPRGYY